ncbi:MAG: hypothetical protein ACK573_06655 [Pseudanabaena sp.]
MKRPFHVHQKGAICRHFGSNIFQKSSTWQNRASKLLVMGVTSLNLF